MGPLSRSDEPTRAARAPTNFVGRSPAQLDDSAVRTAYRRWAPIYDRTFGLISKTGRLHATELINQGVGRVLEVGVGTGLSLPHYAPHLEVVGIDLAPEMLDKARERVAVERLTHVSGLHEMNAEAMTFPDASFDTVVAMYVMTVVPNPENVMRELARVVRPGGKVFLVNHFSQDDGIRGFIERRMAPFGDRLGWHPVFDMSRVTACDKLSLTATWPLRPFGIFTMMQLERRS